MTGTTHVQTYSHNIRGKDIPKDGRPNMQSMRELVFHGSSNGVYVLGLDQRENNPHSESRGACYRGLGPKGEVWFGRFATAYAYANEPCYATSGGVIFGVDPDEAGLAKAGDDYVAHNGVSREHIRFVMIPAVGGDRGNIDKMLEIARRTKELLPTASVMLYPHPIYNLHPGVKLCDDEWNCPGRYSK